MNAFFSWLQKLSYPPAIFFIIGNEFCERFSFYGMTAILTLYLKTKLGYSEDTSTIIYHAFSFFAFLTPVFGAWLADQYLGKFKTIIWISMIYILGHVLKTIAAVPTIDAGHETHVALSLVGLALIALGTGGIKPCVSAFGGDQFKLPEQKGQLQVYFSVFYFAINCGSLLSTFITPILRQDVHCFEEDTCFALAFGVPAVLMAVATLILIVGKPLYVFKPPQGNITSKVCGAIWYALSKKMGLGTRTRDPNKDSHWLDSAKEKYDSKLVEDTKVLLRLFLLYLPLPVFWALFKQQGSRWTFQATRMDGRIGSYIIKPDQMSVTNPLLVIIFIPLFEKIVYPLLNKIGILVKPLQRIIFGGSLAALAFFISGILELQLQKTYAKLPEPGTAHFHIMNTLDLPLKLNIQRLQDGFNYTDEDGNTNWIINATSNHLFENVSVVEEWQYAVTAEINEENCDKNRKGAVTRVYSGNVTTLIFSGSCNELTSIYLGTSEDPTKSTKALSKIRFFVESGVLDNLNFTLRPARSDSKNITVQLEVKEDKLYKHFQQDEVAQSDYITLDPGEYRIYPTSDGDLNETKSIGQLELLQGGVYSATITKNNDTQKPKVTTFKLTNENSVHMLWLVPQYFVITVGEIFFSVTGLEFSYLQAPSSMKSVIQAAWLLTIAFGNLIIILVVVFVALRGKRLEQSTEFFMFGGLMVIDMIIFALMAARYKSIDQTDIEPEDKEAEALANGASSSSLTNEEPNGDIKLQKLS